MELTNHNIIKIVEKYFFELNSDEIRKKIIDELNEIIFYDNFAKFVDMTKDEDIEFSCNIILNIEYKNKLYDISSFKYNFLNKMIRYRKLKKITF